MHCCAEEPRAKRAKNPLTLPLLGRPTDAQAQAQAEALAAAAQAQAKAHARSLSAH